MFLLQLLLKILGMVQTKKENHGFGGPPTNKGATAVVLLIVWPLAIVV